MKTNTYLLLVLLIFLGCTNGTLTKDTTVTFPEDELFDKIKGGLVGQLFGNLNGMPFEQTYNNEAGTFTGYVPGLPNGAYTDDDTDEEWMYIIYMQENKQLYLDYDLITEMWIKHLNRHIYSSIDYGRSLMDIGINAPATGNCILNPWSDGYMSGQITSEVFGLASPGMCESGEKLALHYIASSGSQESLQATQLFTSMIATSFLTDDLDKIIETGLEAMDKSSLSYKAIQDVFRYYEKYPNDWLAARRELRKDYWFVNGTPHLYSSVQFKKTARNAAATILALLYGGGDFVKSMEISFNLGMDADCNAATLGTILGAIKGYKWFEEQGWVVNDIYCNTARDGLPMDETISGYASRILEVAEMNILEQGGKKTEEDGKVVYHVNTQSPKVLERIIDDETLYQDAYETYQPQIMEFFKSDNDDPKDLAKYLYLSLCIRTAEEIKELYPEKFEKAIEACKQFPDFYFQLHKHLTTLQSRLAVSVGLNERVPEPPMEGNVTFKLDGYTDAAEVYLCGSFNDWRKHRTPMLKTEDGWMCRLNLPPGRHTYKFSVVDWKGKRKWVFDPNNDQKDTDCAGWTNSLLIVNADK